jgi:hypothetical protein
MSDLTPLQLDPDAADGGVIGDDEDPWPRRCEALALLLAAVLAFLILSAALVAAGIPLSSGNAGQSALPVVDRLRYASQGVTPLDALIALGGALLVALDGITSGERRGTSTAQGTVALYGIALMSLMVAVASAARFVDVLAGHVDLIGSLPGHVMYRLGLALPQGATSLLAAAACWLAFRTWNDADRVELELQMETEDAEFDDEE